MNLFLRYSGRLINICSVCNAPHVVCEQSMDDVLFEDDAPPNQTVVTLTVSRGWIWESCFTYDFRRIQCTLSHVFGFQQVLIMVRLWSQLIYKCRSVSYECSITNTWYKFFMNGLWLISSSIATKWLIMHSSDP